MTALKHTREPTAEQFIRLQLEPITRAVLTALHDDNNTVDQQTLLDHTNEWLISALQNQSSAHQASKIQKAYQCAALTSGKLKSMLRSLPQDERLGMIKVLFNTGDLEQLIHEHFETFFTQTLSCLDLTQQRELCEHLTKTRHSLLIRALSKINNLSEFCNTLNNAEMTAGSLMIFEVVKQDALQYRQLPKYLRKLNEQDQRALIDQLKTPLTAMMLRSSTCLTMVIQELPTPLARMMWEQVDTYSELYNSLSLSDILRLSEILAADHFIRLFSLLEDRMTTAVVMASYQELASFTFLVLQNVRSMSQWIWERFDKITATLKGFHAFLVIITLINDAFSHPEICNSKQEVLSKCHALYETIHYGLAFNRLNEAGKFAISNLLKYRLKQLITTADAYQAVAPLLYNNELMEILKPLVPEILKSPTKPGDFAKLSSYLSSEDTTSLWVCMKSHMIDTIDLNDLGPLARSLSWNELQNVCNYTQLRVASIVRDSNSFRFIMLNLTEAKQVLLLEWACPALAAHFKSQNEIYLLVSALCPTLQNEWARRLANLHKARLSNPRLFAASSPSSTLQISSRHENIPSI